MSIAFFIAADLIRDQRDEFPAFEFPCNIGIGGIAPRLFRFTRCMK